MKLITIGVVAAALSAISSGQSFVKGHLLVKFKASATKAQMAATVGKTGGNVKKEFASLGLKLIQLPAKADEKAQANALKSRSDVEFAEPDYLFQGAYVPNDPDAVGQWHLAKIEAYNAWDVTQGSSSVIIAILDSGVSSANADLSSKLVAGWNFYNNNSDTSDVNGHGSMVAGVAAAATNNGSGGAGIAFNCKIMPLRISDANGVASASNMAAALQYAADHGAKVANVSFPASASSTIRSAAQYFMSKGGVVAMSSGNTGSFDPTADNPYVLTVSASDSSDNIAGFSTTGNFIDCAAPGDGIMTTAAGGGTTFGSGTSFSAPAVAGVAALMYAANPSLSGDQVYSLLRGSCDDLGSPGWDSGYGWGRINARKAVEAAKTNSGADTINPSVSFAAPLNNAFVSGTINVFVNASDNSAVDRVSYYLDGVLVGTKTSAPYSWTWDTTKATDLYHNLSATAWDLAGNSSSTIIGVNVRNTADTTPPSVRITSPVGGSKIGSKLTITTYANDNVKVTKVELWIDGKLNMTSTSSPFAFNVNTRKMSAGSHSFQLKGYDAAGNVGLSDVVTLIK